MVAMSRKTLAVTAVDTSGACLPIIGVFTLSINASGNIRNYPPQSAPTTAVSPPIAGLLFDILWYFKNLHTTAVSMNKQFENRSEIR